MILQIDGWRFRVDYDATMIHSAQQASDHCTCGYCRNYYEAVQRLYPQLCDLLTRFGVDYQGPDELCPYEPTLFDADYIVQGHVEQFGNGPIKAGDLLIYPEQILDDQGIATIFNLHVEMFRVPWFLDEPANEVISPANTPEFIARMEEKLLQYYDDSSIKS